MLSRFRLVSRTLLGLFIGEVVCYMVGSVFHKGA